MATRSLNVVITGDAKPLGVATQQAGRHMDDVESRGKKMGKTLALGFASAGAAAGGALVVGLKKSVDAAIEAEKSQAKLKAQLNASGISYRAHAKEIDAVIQKHSKLAGVDDEDLQDAFTNIVRATGSVSKAMKDMGLVTDLMRGKNLSAARAGDLLAKVHNGNVGALKRLGIAITPVTTEQDKLRAGSDKATAAQKRAAKAADDSATATKAIGELQRRFSGQAEKYGKTAAGAQDRFRVAVENLQEKIGDKLLPVVTKATNKVSKFVSGMDDGTGSGGSFAKSLGKLTDALEPYTKATGDAVAWTKRHDMAWRVLNDNFPNPMRSLRHLTTILNGIKTAADAVVTAVRGVGKAFGWAGNAAKDVAGALNPFGDGLGKTASSISIPGLGGGGALMGADPDLAPFASLGASMGLHTSSGIRPGSITTSGNVSYHSSGDAIDEAGPMPAMRRYASTLYSKYGGRLRELISPWGELGIKDGKPFRYSGAIQAQHSGSNAHVHVAFTGPFGDGVGHPFASASAARATGYRGFYLWAKKTKQERYIGTGAWMGVLEDYARSIGADPRQVRKDHGQGADRNSWKAKWQRQATGDGIGRIARTGDGIGDIRALWTRAGGSASQQNMAAAIAMAESGGRPSASNRNTDGSIDRGLWQINSIHGAQSTFDRLGNARAAVSISSNGRNWNPWTVFKTGAYKRFLTSGSSGGGSGSAPGKGKPTGTTQGGKLPKITPAFYDPGEGPSDEALAAQGFLDRKAGKGARPAKGGGPSRGISQELADARDNAPAVDPNADLLPFDADIRRMIAEAALTDGTGDGIAAAGSAQWLAQVKYDRAKTSGDPTRIAEAAEGLKTARDTLKALNAVADNTASLTEALKSVEAAITAQTDFAKDVTATSNFQLTKSLADLLSGHIVGRGVAGRAFTPGSGVEYAY